MNASSTNLVIENLVDALENGNLRNFQKIGNAILSCMQRHTELVVAGGYDRKRLEGAIQLSDQPLTDAREYFINGKHELAKGEYICVLGYLVVAVANSFDRSITLSKCVMDCCREVLHAEPMSLAISPELERKLYSKALLADKALDPEVNQVLEEMIHFDS